MATKRPRRWHISSEVIAIYPITPASPMGELADAWSSLGKENIFGTCARRDRNAKRSRRGRHGSRRTANRRPGDHLHRLAGPAAHDSRRCTRSPVELTPTVFHIAARTIATHCLSIFGDHSDVMACRQQVGRCCACQFGPRSPRSGAGCPRRHIGIAGTVSPFLRWFSHFARSQQDRATLRRRLACNDRRSSGLPPIALARWIPIVRCCAARLKTPMCSFRRAKPAIRFTMPCRRWCRRR